LITKGGLSPIISIFRTHVLRLPRGSIKPKTPLYMYSITKLDLLLDKTISAVKTYPGPCLDLTATNKKPITQSECLSTT
jgi:hypothetical protein